MDTLHCILLQSDIIWKNPEANREKYARYFQQLPKDLDLLLLPEMCMSGFDTGSTDTAERPGGESSLFLRQWAMTRDTAIAAGLAVRENGKVYNRLLWTFPDGNQVHYDKRHLFRMGEEPLLYTPGNRDCIVQYKSWNIQLQICYDLRFPTSCRNAFRDGKFRYDLLVFVANWPESRRDAMMTLARARAIENQAYVLLCNRTGTDGNGINYGGDSLIIDYKGQVMASRTEKTEGFVQAELSLSALTDFRVKFPTFRDWDT